MSLCFFLSCLMESWHGGESLWSMHLRIMLQGWWKNKIRFWVLTSVEPSQQPTAYSWEISWNEINFHLSLLSQYYFDLWNNSWIYILLILLHGINQRERANPCMRWKEAGKQIKRKESTMGKASDGEWLSRVCGVTLQHWAGSSHSTNVCWWKGLS